MACLAKRLQSIAQAGLAYSHDPYDLERFREIRAVAADIVSRYMSLDIKTVASVFCNEEGYQTPKVDVRAVAFRDNGILLVRESKDGKWSLPGGWAEVDLSLKENAVKEMKEEAGMDAIPRRILAVLDASRHGHPSSLYGIYKVFILCELTGGSFQENIETTGCAFFPPDRLPALSVKRVTPEQVRMCFRLSKDEHAVTVFD